jgi:hypothetical protein
MLVVVLNDWVTDTKLVPAASNASTSFAKSSSERGQPVDLVDDDDVDALRGNIRQQSLQCRPLQGTSRRPAIVINLAGAGPAFARL